ncbi:wd g-beta repeat-containing protein, partial [Cystoisospora suis]
MLIDVFDSIDTNGINLVTWEAFANALVEESNTQHTFSPSPEGGGRHIRQYEFLSTSEITNSRDRIE